MKKRQLVFVLVLFLLGQFVFAQSTIMISYPTFPAEWCKLYEKIGLNFDGQGRISSLEKDGNVICSVSYEKKKIVANRNDGKTFDVNSLYDIKKKDNSYVINYVNGRFYWSIENGTFVNYDTKTDEILSFFLYSLVDSTYLISYYKALDYADKLGYAINKMCYACEGMLNDYKCPKDLVNSIKSKKSDINISNAKILLLNNLQFMIPLLLSDDDFVSSPVSYTASSELKENGVLYKAENLQTTDGLPWISANKNGIGDKISIILPAAQGTKFSFINGSSDALAYKDYARAHAVKIKNVETGFSKVILLEDTADPQVFSFEDIWMFIDLYKTLEITIESVYPGEKYENLCIQSIIPVYY